MAQSSLNRVMPADEGYNSFERDHSFRASAGFMTGKNELGL